MRTRAGTSVDPSIGVPAIADAMTELRYILPGRPTSWKRTTGKGRARFTDPAMRAAKASHALRALAARQAWVLARRRPWPMAGEFEIEVLAFMPDRRGLPDWDNLGKLISDAIEGIVYENDRQVSDGIVRRRIDAARPRTEVVIRRREAA